MKLTAKINNVDVRFSGAKEDVAYIAKTLLIGEKKQSKSIGTKKSKTLIKKVDAVTVEINGVKLSPDDKSVSKVAGTDYCVYEQNGTYVISDNKNVKNAKKIGGFHYGLISENFIAQNNIDKKHASKIAGINAYSIWDEKHRPTCEPYGMVYVKKANIWVDIYLCNSDYKNVGTSFAKGAILAGHESEGRELPNDFEEFKYKDFVDAGNEFGKRMLTKDEFQIAMDGVKENVSAEDLDNGKIQHIDFLTSKFGIEQATGVQWVWSADKYKDYDDTAVVLGGHRGHGVDAGSRASDWDYYVWTTYWAVGCRFACDHLQPAK
jgi:hypothetical protein